MKRRLFFVVNQDPWDGSAHGLYCMRHLRALAESAPDGWSIVFVCPSRVPEDFVLPPNIEVVGLPSLRRGSNILGLHMNAVFHWAAWDFLKKNARHGDIVATASFPRLFAFLASRFRKQAARPKLVYEIHQLECLSLPPEHEKCRLEFDALALADRLLTTTGPLEAILRQQFPNKPCKRTGLACGYAPVEIKPHLPGQPFRVGYFGSVSPEQGIPWLVESWPVIRQNNPNLELQIFGRTRRGEIAPETDSDQGIFVFSPVPPDELPTRCLDLDALIIPALDRGHRSSIAFTKAYDYVGLALPIVACDLPTIREVLRPEIEALLFPPGDIRALQDSLRRLIDDVSLRQHLHTACVVRASELSWTSRAGQWWSAITE
jgi:glycosyltransferase involved in cell wall biosynthesis